MAVTYCLLLCIEPVIHVYDGRKDFWFQRKAIPSTDMSPRENSEQTTACSHHLVALFRSDNAVILRTFALGISLTVVSVLGTYNLSFAPLESSVFWRSLIVPVSMVAAQCFATKVAVSFDSVVSATTLCVGILMAAYRPDFPQLSRPNWAAITECLFAATWPFQLDRAIRLSGTCSEPKYQGIGRGLGSGDSTADPLKDQALLRWLQNIALGAVIILAPLVLLSGELDRISRNCYFSQVPTFWVFLLSGGTFRCILLISSALFIKFSSALSYIILILLVEVSQVILLTYTKPLSSQWLALGLCLISGMWLYWLSYSSSPETSGYNSLGHSGGEGSTSEGRFVQIALRISCAILLTASLARIFQEQSTRPVSGKISPISDSGNSPVKELLRGTDAYLGKRPHVDAVANLSMLIEACRGTYEQVEHIYDVRLCLDFLSTQQDKYLDTPVRDASSSSANTVEHNADECGGLIIPYHIWWTGLPTWRIELFIKSYFYTQNLACSRLWIWVNTHHHPDAMNAWHTSPDFQRFMPLVARGDIILKVWKLPSRVPLPPNLDEVDKARFYTSPGTPNAQGEQYVADAIIRDSNGQEWIEIYTDGDEPQITYYTVAVSDAARLIILHLHGGVYMDPDMLILRDLRPLLLGSQGFAERWGTVTDPTAYNNALLYIPANSTISSYLLLGGTRAGLVYHFLALGRMLAQEDRDDKHVGDVRSLLKLENAFFDPIWVEFDGKRSGRCSVPCLTLFEQLFQGAPVDGEWDTFDGEVLEGSPNAPQRVAGNGNQPPTTNRTLDTFYRGAYAMHMHNLWNLQYEIGSWIDVVVHAHDGFFAGERTNAYGERWKGPKIEGYLET